MPAKISSDIPLKVNTGGVIPVIFASSILSFFSMAGPLFEVGTWPRRIIDQVAYGMPLYNLLYVAGIIFFAYFYTAIIFNPDDVAENMRKYGGFIPGIRPGRKTAEYIDRVLSRITLPGAVFLALIAVLPDVMIAVLGAPFLGFGGTSVLIVVGVALDTLQQIESHLIMRHYEGFVKRGRIRGRQRM